MATKIDLLRRTRSRLWLLLAPLALLAAACGSDAPEVVAGPGALGHIHDLRIDDGVVYVASHSGLYRIDALDQAILRGTEQHDLMAMTGLPNGDLLASGHPDLRLEEYIVDDHPPLLGLARSTDFGDSWDGIELLGDADFHALVPVGDELFAAESSGQIWYRDPDGAWSERGEIEARDLAVDPGDSALQVAADWDGMVWSSNDGAMSWSIMEGAPTMIEIEWTESGLVGANEDGSIWTAASADGLWTQTATGPEEIETFHIDDSGEWWAAVHGGRISRSNNNGTTWQVVYEPPGAS